MIVAAPDFEAWRAAARGLLAAGVPPSDVLFDDGTGGGLFAADPPPSPTAAGPPVPRAFVALAEAVACHRDPQRWGRLYRTLWRLTHGEAHLLDLATDDDINWLLRAEKAVRRDSHKMKAFVRFRRVGGHYVAWHRPDHRVVRRTAPFFARRFPEMRWAILTPDESAAWDGRELHFGPGVPAKDAPPPDVLEDLWKAYYRSTFNPARIKVRAMKKELPVRHWPTLPEAAIIPDLLAEAPARVAAMVAHKEGLSGSAADFLPTSPDLASLREAARGCAACGLCRYGRTVFGDGPADARVVLVGEGPDADDGRAGRPFAGPAGGLLDEALREAGLDRAAVYVTHAVKHVSPDRRADVRELNACRPWLAAEVDSLGPKVIVCLGPAAARAVLGPVFRYADRRGEVVATATGAKAVATHGVAGVARSADRRAELVRHLALARQAAG